MAEKCAYETEDERYIKCGKAQNALTCPKCGGNMQPTKKPGEMKWDCENILDGCYHTFSEPIE